MNLFIRRKSDRDYSLLLSTIALVVAIGTGTAYALRVNSSDIVDDTIRSIDVRDDTLTNVDINEGTLGYPKQLRRGQTVRGVIGARDNVGTSLGSIVAVASIPAAHPQGLSNPRVVVAGGADNAEATCNGGVPNPTAPKGFVCIYPVHTSNAANIRGLSMRDPPFGILWGFRLAWEPTVANQLSLVEAVWAYQAP